MSLRTSVIENQCYCEQFCFELKTLYIDLKKKESDDKYKVRICGMIANVSNIH